MCHNLPQKHMFHSLPEQQCTFMIAELNTTYKKYIFLASLKHAESITKHK